MAGFRHVHILEGHVDPFCWSSTFALHYVGNQESQELEFKRCPITPALLCEIKEV